jgi:hypothetical protein
VSNVLLISTRGVAPRPRVRTLVRTLSNTYVRTRVTCPNNNTWLHSLPPTARSVWWLSTRGSTVFAGRFMTSCGQNSSTKGEFHGRLSFFAHRGENSAHSLWRLLLLLLLLCVRADPRHDAAGTWRSSIFDSFGLFRWQAANADTDRAPLALFLSSADDAHQHRGRSGRTEADLPG